MFRLSAWASWLSWLRSAQCKLSVSLTKSARNSSSSMQRMLPIWREELLKVLHRETKKDLLTLSVVFWELQKHFQETKSLKQMLTSRAGSLLKFWKIQKLHWWKKSMRRSAKTSSTTCEVIIIKSNLQIDVLSIESKDKDEVYTYLLMNLMSLI